MPPIAALDFAKNPLNLEFKFKGGFGITIETKSIFDGYKDEYVGEKRTWYTLWILKKAVYRQKAVYVDRDFNVADIPSVSDLNLNWTQQYGENETQVVQVFAKWLVSQIEELNALVKKEQEAIVAAYRQKLESARKSAELRHAAEMEQLLPLYEEAKRLNEDFSTLADVKFINA